MKKPNKVIVSGYRLCSASFGEGQANFSVITSKLITADQVEQIAMFLKQGADQMRAIVKSSLDKPADTREDIGESTSTTQDNQLFDEILQHELNHPDNQE